MPNSEKIRLRQIYRFLRSQISEADRLEAEKNVCLHLFSLPEISSAFHIGLYCSFSSELDTGPLISRATKEGRSVYLPYVIPETMDMQFAAHDGNRDAMICNRLGVLEPRGEAVPRQLLEVIVVPGIAFDVEGNRLGHGAGYYDRFLKKVSVPKIGIAFEAQIAPRLPVGPNDVKMDILVTENGVRRLTPFVARR